MPTGDGDDPRDPADSGLGYAWAEFGRVDEEGQPRYFVCGLGASARRGSGTSPVATWQFLTALRPGKDISLSAGERPVEEKDLKKVDGVRVLTNAALYRDRLAAELFELDTTSYDNLTELLKQLRKPKLGERLNPASLADTLREALPPLATNEITQLAEGWDHLELLRRAVERAEESAAAVAGFIRTGWRPWARAVVRQRADVLAEATTKLDNTTRDKRRAEGDLADATSKVTTAGQNLANTKRTKVGRDTELRELLESRSYRDAVAAAGRVESLRRDVVSLSSQQRAAVVAYDAAGPHAPRWVWLDEAMTGVDTGVKASFMALTVSFQLDVMLTAHDEWCNYRTVPAVAVYDLARHSHLPGVDVMPYLWCGGELTQVDVDRLGPTEQPDSGTDVGLLALLEPEQEQ